MRDYRYGVGGFDGVGVTVSGDDFGAHYIQNWFQNAIVEEPAGEFQASGWLRGGGFQVAEGYAFAVVAVSLQDIAASADHGGGTISPAHLILPEQGIVYLFGFAQRRLGLHVVQAQQHGDDVTRIARVDVANQGDAALLGCFEQ